MRKLIIIALTFVASVSMAQTKPRRVVIKKSVTINRDSIAYLPHTIPVAFKELIIKPDTIFEKWNKGFVVWQTWVSPFISYNTVTMSGTWTIRNTSNELSPHEVKYQFSEMMPGKFLYSNYKPVTNKVIYSIAR